MRVMPTSVPIPGPLKSLRLDGELVGDEVVPVTARATRQPADAEAERPAGAAEEKVGCGLGLAAGPDRRTGRWQRRPSGGPESGGPTRAWAEPPQAGDARQTRRHSDAQANVTPLRGPRKRWPFSGTGWGQTRGLTPVSDPGLSSTGRRTASPHYNATCDVRPGDQVAISRFVEFTRAEWARLRASTPLPLTEPQLRAARQHQRADVARRGRRRLPAAVASPESVRRRDAEPASGDRDVSSAPTARACRS